LEEGIEFLVLATLVGLYGDDIAIKLALYHLLEVMKFLENIIFVSYQINPSKLAEIINKTQIIIVSPYGSRS
jgi:hypothetical protein